jgi:hypothetical protein
VQAGIKRAVHDIDAITETERALVEECLEFVPITIAPRSWVEPQ